VARIQEPNEDRDRLLRANTPPFRGCTFKAFLNRKTLGFLESGDMRVAFVIPQEEIVNKAEKLRLLLSNPMPLQITVEVDASYLEDVIKDEISLRLISGNNGS